MSYETAADAWYERNKNKLGANQDDPVMRMMERNHIVPKMVLEIGCADGWRLNRLKEKYGCTCRGVELSPMARKSGKILYPDIDIHKWWDFEAGIDCIIFGFVFYIMERRKVFASVYTADTILSEGGHIIIHDFFPAWPHAVPNKHHDGMYVYKTDYSKYFRADPAYELVDYFEWPSESARDEGDMTGVAVLKKNSKRGWEL